jgi:ketosteroid isomerase-like protein
MVTTVERRGFEGLEGLCSDVEIDVSELLDGRILRGRTAVEAYWQALHTDAWQELTMDVEAIAQQDDVVVALVRWRAVGRGSGVPVEMPAAWVATLRDGQVTSARLTLDREGALEAVAPSAAPAR